MSEQLEPVLDDADHNRFVVRENGSVAELVYRRNGRRLVLVHTEVPEALREQGIGARLVSAAVEQARAEGLTLVPLCPYARHWLETHPDAASGVKID
jgi:uncharacterized protein